MKTFITEDFMLYGDTARELYHGTADGLPIIDFHNHLNTAEILADKNYSDISEVWLGGDHYKWRAMRANGIPERLITGDGAPYDKFAAWADTVRECIGNPLYHWTHLELLRYFDIKETLEPASAKAIFEEANAKLAQPDFSTRALLKRQGVKVLCTTDDPKDDLLNHKKLAATEKDLHVYPTFRPDKAIQIEKDTFADYIKELGEVAGCTIDSVEELLSVLYQRLDFFIEHGCRVSDHSLENAFFCENSYSKDEAERIFSYKLKNYPLSEEDLATYHGYILMNLGKKYAEKGIVMQLHIGALRNNSTRMFKLLGVDTGYDCLNDFNFAPMLSALLDAMDKDGLCPKVILYCLNPKDLPMLAAMAGNFQGNDDGTRGKIQLGTAWWFIDHAHGMETQMQALMDVGLISTFVGMLTDSRSFLSFPRHEYFRRILCNMLGSLVDKGQYPRDMEYLSKLVRGICHDNAEKFFNLKE